MTVPSARNLSLKEYEKISICKDLEIEIQKMWVFESNSNASCSWDIWYDKEEN